MGDPIFALVPLGASVRRLKADGSLDKYPTRILELSELTRDRKSTRLNSSHSQISYAVFCLKKKNSNIQPIIQGPSLTSAEPILSITRHNQVFEHLKLVTTSDPSPGLHIRPDFSLSSTLLA